MSANENTSGHRKRPRRNSAGTLRLDDLIARKDIKGGRGSVVFGERSDPAPGREAVPAPKPPRKRHVD